jgi:SAM-dependent methyltransferase
MDEGRDDSCGGRARAASTAGYASDADRLARQYESVTFDAVHGAVLPYLDVAPCLAADLGAGTGRDAAALSARGHRVTAVEPVAELRAIGQRLHPDAGISWLNDALPDLPELEGPFGLVLITAVWMHLDAEERARGLRRVAGLLGDGARLVLKLRHGPVPAGRRMFDVTPEEVTDGAAGLGLELLHREHRGDLHGRDDVTWTSLVFERPCPGLSCAAQDRAGKVTLPFPAPIGRGERDDGNCKD